MKFVKIKKKTTKLSKPKTDIFQVLEKTKKYPLIFRRKAFEVEKDLLRKIRLIEKKPNKVKNLPQLHAKMTLRY